MEEEGHRAFVASWTAEGRSCDDAGEEIPNRAARRAWCCTCGWRGAVRDIDGRFFRPPGDVADRLRASRVRRSDRAAEHAWRTHAEAAVLRTIPACEGRASSEEQGTRGGADAQPGPSTEEAGGAQVVSLHAPRGISERALRAQRRAATTADGSARSAPAKDGTPDDGCDGRDVVELRDASTSAVAAPPSALDPVAAAAAHRDRVQAALAAADVALRQAVQQARDAGLSWRAIAASAGVDHRSARQQWAGE